MEEIKTTASVRSFRITDETLNQFKKIQDDKGLTQEAALKSLITTYELEQAKSTIPERETEIANFQTKADELVSAFLHSLQLNLDAESRIRSEFTVQLQSKDETIVDLQQKVAEMKEKNAKISAEMDEAKAANKSISEELSDARTAEFEAKNALSDKERIIAMQTTEIDRLTAEVATIPGLKKETEALRSENSSLQKEKEATERDLQAAKETAERTISDLKKEADRISADHEKALQTIKKEAETAAVIAKQTAENEKKSAVLETKEFYIAKMEAKDNEIRDLERQVAELQKALTVAKQKPAPVAPTASTIEQMTIEETDLF